MTANRRDFLKTAALSAVVLGGGGVAHAATGSATARRVLAIGTGLDSDRAFARGAAAETVATPLASPDGYSALIQTIEAARGSLFLALVEPAMALLVEEAAMDCRLAMIARTPVRAPHGTDVEAWAHSLGRSLALGNRPRQPLSTYPSAALSVGRALVALALR